MAAKHSMQHEKILQKLHELYTTPSTGLIDVAKRTGLDLLPPRKKIFVLLVGNHSAGKSSFINWYIEETLQKTGVAIETKNITFITSGKKKESLGGEATLQAFPLLGDLCKSTNVVASLSTQVSPSRVKGFPLVTFIDTPGLVDGEMRYNFDIEQSLLWLGGLSDLILVFFDPLGQSLCKRTLDIVERLQLQCVETHKRMELYLSKADTAGTDIDRQKVIWQIAQNLCRRPALNSVASELPTIYIPKNDGDPLGNRIPNQIEDIVGSIDNTIRNVLQNSLNQFKRDSSLILDTINTKLDHNRDVGKKSMQDLVTSVLCLAAACVIVSLVVLTQLYASPGFEPETPLEHVAYFCDLFGGLLGSASSTMIGKFGPWWMLLSVVSTLVIVGMQKLVRRRAVLTARQVDALQQDYHTVSSALERNFASLYSQYIGDAVGSASSA